MAYDARVSSARTFADVLAAKRVLEEASPPDEETPYWWKANGEFGPYPADSVTINVALDAYIFLCRFLPLPMRKYMRNVLARFPRSVRRLTIYDQLNPAYAKYYREDEARALLERHGFRNVRTHHRHGYSWSVAGETSRP